MDNGLGLPCLIKRDAQLGRSAMEASQMRSAVFGLGYVGLVRAACLPDRGTAWVVAWT